MGEMCGLGLHPSFPGPLTAVLREIGCVGGPSPALALSPPFCFPVFEPNEFNKIQHIGLPFHFWFDVCVRVGEGGSSSESLHHRSVDREPSSSTHHLARPHLPAFTSRVRHPSEGEGISRLKGLIGKKQVLCKP